MGVQVSDDLDGSDTRFFRIGVPEISGPRSHGANHPPVLDYIPDQEVDERDILSFTATATDQDNDYLTYTWSDVPSGAVIIGRSFSWYAPPAAAGFHAPEVTVSDGHGGTDDQLVNIEVKEVPPVFSADGYLYSGCSPIILNISHTATDPNGIDSLIRYHIEGSPAGTTTINERTGAVTWSIPADTVQDHFDIVATDYDGRTADLLILFREDDSSDCDKPPILSYINDRRVRAGHTLAFDVTATDPDGLDSALTYSLEDAPSGASITSSNGVGRFSWTPSLSQVGSHEITFVVTDEDDLSADQSVTIRVTQPPPPPNDRPVINRIADQQVNETDTLAFNITATDPDGPEDSIRFGLSSPPAGATITTLAANSTHAIGAFSWTPSEAQGPANHTITITAVDNKGASSSEPFLVTVREVNVPPTLEPIGDRDLDELTLLTFVAVANDTDIPHTLTYSLDGPPEGARIDPANGTFSWIPTEQQGPGNYTITVTVDDGLGGAASRSFNVTVREVNLQPVLAPISNYTTIELTPVAFTATARDPDGQDIAYGLVDPPAGAAIDPSTGRFVWEPARGQAGNHQITVAASDGFGGMASQSFAVQVDQAPPGIRFAPVSSAADGRGGFEELDGAFGVDTIDISGRAYAVVASQDDSGIQIIDLTDPSTPRPVSYLSDDAAMALGSATSVAAAQISGRAYAVVASWIDDGVQIVDITDPSFPVPVSSILDGPSTRLEGARGVAIHQVPGHAYAVVTALDDDSVQIVNITDPANPDPTAFIRDAPATVLEQPWGVAVHQISGRAYAITAAWFGDGIQIIDLADPANPDPTASVRSGSATLLSEAKDVAAFDMNGRTYAAVASEHSNAIQLVDVTDPSSPDPTGHILDDQSTLLDGASGVDVFKVAGRAYAVAVSINEGGIQLIEVTDPRNPRAIAAIPDDEHTLLSATTDVAVFRVGNAIYAAVTSHGEDGIQIVRLGSGGNAAPSIDPVPPQTVDELTLLEFDVTASDPDHPPDTLVFSLAGPPANATINETTGAFSWTPAEDQDGTHQVTVAVSDGAGGSATATVEVTVNEVNVPPELHHIPDIDWDELAALTILVNATDHDLPPNTLTFNLTGHPPEGAAIDPSNGTLAWTPTEQQGPGNYTITVTVDDGAGGTASGAFNVTVQEANQPPRLAEIPHQNAEALNPLTVQANATDPDLPPNTLSYRLSAHPVNATIDPVNGIISWIPSEPQAGLHRLTVTVDDGAGGTASQTFNVTVLEQIPPDPPRPGNTARGRADHPDAQRYRHRP